MTSKVTAISHDLESNQHDVDRAVYSTKTLPYEGMLGNATSHSFAGRGSRLESTWCFLQRWSLCVATNLARGMCAAFSVVLIRFYNVIAAHIRQSDILIAIARTLRWYCFQCPPSRNTLGQPSFRTRYENGREPLKQKERKQ